MANPDILRYITEGRRRGFALSLLKENLRKGGFEESEIHEAILLFPSSLRGDTSSTFSTSTEKISFATKLKYALAHPEKLFERTMSERTRSAWVFQELLLTLSFLVLGVGLLALFKGVVLTAPAQILSLITENESRIGLIVSLLAITMYGIIPAFIFLHSAVVHLFVRIMKNTTRYQGTHKSFIYATVPLVVFAPFFIILSFVPPMGQLVAIGILGMLMLWSVILLVKALAHYHEISHTKAFIAYLLGTVFLGLALYSFIISITLITSQFSVPTF